MTKLSTVAPKLIARLPQLLTELAQNWQFLQQGWSTEIFQQFNQHLTVINTQADLEQLAGLAQACRNLLTILRPLQQRHTPATHIERANINQQLTELIQVAESLITGSKTADPVIPLVQVSSLRYAHHKLVYLFDPDEARNHTLTQALNQRGYDVMVFTQLEGFNKALKQRVPAAILMDLPSPVQGKKFNGPQLILNLQKQRRQPVPIIFTSVRYDMAARLIAVRARGHAFFTHPLDVNALIDKLDQLTFNTVPPLQVLLVDDTGQGNCLLKPLRQMDMIVRTLTDPMRTITALQRLHPSLLLVNLHLVGVGALELVQVVRQQEHYSHIPIVFFSSHGEEAWPPVALHGIADDFVSLSASPAQIIATITNSLKNTEQRNYWLHTLYYRDQLTGLYNQQYLLKKLNEVEKAPDSKTPLAVIYINMYYHRNVDKIVNFAATEAVVLETARLLRGQLSQQDILIRLNDRVFVILSVHRTLEQIQHFANAVGTQLSQQITNLDEQRIHTKWSIGIGLFHEASPEPLSAFFDAEVACAEAHNYGSNHVHLHESVQVLQSDQMQQNQWEHVIRQGLETNQFYLAYQPIAKLHGDTQEYYDVLLRLYSAQGRREISAAEFMAAAEQAQLVAELDQWVIHQALQNLAKKHQNGQMLRFFVRLSQASLQQIGFLPLLQSWLSETNVPPVALVFDLSLEAASVSIQASRQFVQAVQALGCQVCLRDVNAQVDSLQLVKLLDVNFVKISAALVQYAQHNPTQLKAIETIVLQVHRLNKAVIAPFVEDADSLQLLWQYGVDYIIGHFIQTPGESLDFDFSM